MAQQIAGREFIDLLKKYCIDREGQQVIEDAFTRMLDQYHPEPKKSSGFTHYNSPGCCQLCGSLTCNGGCFK